ncbi:DUF7541 family protein [Halococcoides cellulosivorans]|uniref:Cox cluster protein n=1 Tax=Halococcoides cellulosivorans TaxID=1679096 RepID=A0A2R4X0Z9_9EURY|nr:hypothetical protein [Halococcoides cellulosivorans]AWB27472.1 hypothetical protein HARCEL1_07010 [Halococcoides cellulosivorans]
MVESTGVAEEFDRSSPWPLLIALGLALSEFGVFFGGIFVPVGVAGIVLFAGSVVGILVETGYVDSHRRGALIVGGTIVLIGGVLYGFSAVSVQFDLYTRAFTVVVGGLLAVGAALVLGALDATSS